MDYGHMRLWNMAKDHFSGLNTYVWSVRMIQDTKMSMISPPNTQTVPDHNLTHMRPQNISATAPGRKFRDLQDCQKSCGAQSRPKRGPKWGGTGCKKNAPSDRNMNMGVWGQYGKGAFLLQTPVLPYGLLVCCLLSSLFD